MKSIEMIKNLARSVLIGGLGGFLSLGISASAWGGDCVQDVPGASTVMTSNGPTSCDTVNGQFGCRVRFNGSVVGGCIVYDDLENRLFTVVSRANNGEGLSWTIEDSTTNTPLAAKVNTVILRIPDVSNGNACRYIYANEATSGSGQGWSDDDEFADVTEAWFCTDGETDDTPAPICDPTACDALSPEGVELFVATFKRSVSDWDPKACTCFAPSAWTACNEDATVEGGANKCTGDGINQALPVHFEAINDGTTICRTIGGERKCWKR